MRFTASKREMVMTSAEKALRDALSALASRKADQREPDVIPPPPEKERMRVHETEQKYQRFVIRLNQSRDKDMERALGASGF
jgi:hypothetical protein